MVIKCNLRQFRKMGRHYNHYYEKFTEAIQLKCGYDLDYIKFHTAVCLVRKIIGNCNYKLVILIMQITFLELVVVQ